mmetsp:Transcript_38609/g.122665  ORF Transcript_38609/g.122665 Transcript_38609/m.122665 type:complete len:381 (+) Transcript_38609:670-1812(+)
MGLDARWARDWTDHVWTEVWSPHLGRWVHADPGEERYDTPLLYEGGWGKKLTYVIAFDAGGVTDVTRRYTARWGETLARRGAVPEAWLAAEVGAAGGRLRAALPPSERILRERRDLEEEDELRAGPAGGGGGGALPGRLTGSLEWRSGRGELGGARGDNAPPAEAGAPAFDDDVAASVPGRAVGGWVTASGENAPHESAVRAFDGRNDTKWLDFGAAGGREAWISYRLSPETKSKAVVSYSMTSGGASPLPLLLSLCSCHAPPPYGLHLLYCRVCATLPSVVGGGVPAAPRLLQPACLRLQSPLRFITAGPRLLQPAYQRLQPPALPFMREGKAPSVYCAYFVLPKLLLILHNALHGRIGGHQVMRNGTVVLIWQSRNAP